MTYCCGLLLRDGLVMIADTRTNAGVDNVSTFRKLHLIEAEDRCMAIATAGNLSVTQSALSLLAEGVPGEDGCEAQTLRNAPTMFAAATLIGDMVRRVKTGVAAAIEPEINADVTLLLGGQIGGGPMHCSSSTAKVTSSNAARTRRFSKLANASTANPSCSAPSAGLRT